MTNLANRNHVAADPCRTMCAHPQACAPPCAQACHEPRATSLIARAAILQGWPYSVRGHIARRRYDKGKPLHEKVAKYLRKYFVRAKVRHLRAHGSMCTDMCVDMSADMCMDMWMDIHVCRHGYAQDRWVCTTHRRKELSSRRLTSPTYVSLLGPRTISRHVRGPSTSFPTGCSKCQTDVCVHAYTCACHFDCWHVVQGSCAS